MEPREPMIYLHLICPLSVYYKRTKNFPEQKGMLILHYQNPHYLVGTIY